MLALLLVLVLTNTALSVWQRLADLPLAMQLAYAVLLLGASTAAVLLAWRWLKPRNTEIKSGNQANDPPANVETVQQNLEQYSQAGIDVSAALEELDERQRRRSNGEVYIAVFGEVSTGKSSLVTALVPGASLESDPRAGTTQDIRHYQWISEAGDRINISDLPGFNQANKEPGESGQLDEGQDLDHAAMEEARRAHLVVFLCGGDLSRTQFDELAALRLLDKPLILAINKSDRYEDAELASLKARLADSTGLERNDIVSIRSGGREEVIRLLADGSEEISQRERSGDVEPLRSRIQYHLDSNQELMESLRESAVMLLVSEKLDSARQAHREEQSALLIRKYSQRAVVGAMAAVAPGSDLVIQGVLATRLVQELCRLYDVNVKEVQVESFLKLAGGKVKRMSALTLAIAGNGLKAFPGLGTLSGGLLHAVAYGMIFDSLGRAAAQTLASRGDLRPLPAARAFEEIMNENLATGAGRFAKLAVSSSKQNKSS